MRFSGTVTVSDATFGAVAREVALSAIAAGFRNVVLMGDHGGGQGTLKRVASELEREWSPKGTHVYYVGDVYYKSGEQVLQYLGKRAKSAGGHAGIHDTSELMFLDKEQKWIRKDKLAPADPNAGVDGDPREASAELGKAFLEIKINNAVAQIKALLAAHRRNLNLVKYRYYTCDVFTETRFGGNPLAVLPQAEGLSQQQMQRSRASSTSPRPRSCFPRRRVRRATSGSSLRRGKYRLPVTRTWEPRSSSRVPEHFGEIKSGHTVTFEEEAGLVPITVYAEHGKVVRCELTAPQVVSVGRSIAPDLVAAAGVPYDRGHRDLDPSAAGRLRRPAFLITELKDRSALERCPRGCERIRRARGRGYPALIAFLCACERMASIFARACSRH
jgi:hypothetical protein